MKQMKEVHRSEKHKTMNLQSFSFLSKGTNSKIPKLTTAYERLAFVVHRKVK